MPEPDSVRTDGYDFSTLGISPELSKCLTEMAEFASHSMDHLSRGLELPDSAPVLDLASRSQSVDRQFSHIHQMCLMHGTHFEMANKIKATYIIDSYLWAARGTNPVTVYSAARSLLELHAILRYVELELVRMASGPSEEWRDRGCRYFQLLIQARFGTTDPEKQKLLRDSGVPESSRQPIRTGKARKALMLELPWIDAHYAMLCDYVHHNLSSLSIAGALAGRGTVARSGGGGKLLLKGEGSLIQYAFPMPEAGKQAIQKTAECAVLNMRGIVSAINGFPHSPYSEQELQARTGSPIGLKELPAEVPRVGRNEPCPCGSKLKYKKCHGQI